MNASQIDPTGAVTGERVVGYAEGVDLQRKLDEGFLCGGWSKKRRLYAVLRPSKKRGRKSKISGELEREAMQLRDRLIDIAATADMDVRSLMKRLAYLRRMQQ